MVYINEWLPNPVGKDSEGEWVEIFNGGDGVVSLSGWYLKTNTNTKFVLSGEVEPSDFLVFRKPNLKLSLNNADGELFLHDAKGVLVDRQSFLGLAPEGKSYSRALDGTFLFSEPTPREGNKFLEQTELFSSGYQAGTVLNQNLGLGEFFALTLVSAAVITGFLIFAIKKHENLSKLFFGRDEEVWR